MCHATVKLTAAVSLLQILYIASSLLSSAAASPASLTNISTTSQEFNAFAVGTTGDADGSLEGQFDGCPLFFHLTHLMLATFACLSGLPFYNYTLIIHTEVIGLTGASGSLFYCNTLKHHPCALDDWQFQCDFSSMPWVLH